MTANFAKGQLKSFVQRIERLEEEKRALGEDIREVYAEAKGTGFDTKALRAVVKLRMQDAEERKEHEALVDLYLDALGMLGDTPLGRAAVDRAVKEAPAKKRSGRKAALVEKVAEKLTKLGTPVPLTDEEKAKGFTAAVVNKDGTRMAIGVGGRGPRQVDLEEAIASAEASGGVRTLVNPKHVPPVKVVKAAADRAESGT